MRVLEIQLTSPESHIRCSLSIRPILDSRPFTALSYRWEIKKAETPIFINGHPVIVMDTVQQFLLQQQRKARYDDIFIDCLCINQEDLEE